LNEAGAALRYVIPIAYVCDLFEGILLHLRNGELICKNQLRKEKPELHGAMNTNYFLFPSLTLVAGW
jgi:hypothetical protein